MDPLEGRVPDTSPAGHPVPEHGRVFEQCEAVADAILVALEHRCQQLVEVLACSTPQTLSASIEGLTLVVEVRVAARPPEAPQ